MYSLPIYAIPKPHSPDLRLVNDHSAGHYSLNSMIDHTQVTGYPLDNLHLFGTMLIRMHTPHTTSSFVNWKSDISEAYRMCPMHPVWQLKQAVYIDGEYYIDRANCFGSSASFAIFVSVNSLISWIAKHKRDIGCLMIYADDSSGVAESSDIDLYEPYNFTCPTQQATLLRLWDELGVPHKPSKQLSAPILPIIGIDVDPNLLTFTLPVESRARLIDEFREWTKPGSRFRLCHWQTLAGWINWALNVYPLLHPCLNNFYPKIAGKFKRGERIWVGAMVRDDFEWALQILNKLAPVYLLKSTIWGPEQASVIVLCDACPTGLGFWFPATSVGFYSTAPAGVHPSLIFFLEALSVLSGLQQVCSELRGHQCILLYTDNLNTVDIFSSLRCLPDYNEILKKSIDLRLDSHADVRVLHVPGEQNQVADALS